MTSSPPCDRSYLSSSGALRVIHVFRSCHKSPVGIFFFLSLLVKKYVLEGDRGQTSGKRGCTIRTDVWMCLKRKRKRRERKRKRRRKRRRKEREKERRKERRKEWVCNGQFEKNQYI